MSPVDRERIVKLDKRRVWRPYTEMGNYRENVDPLVVVEANGSRLIDSDGRSYIDANASWWTMALGHNHPRLIGALQRQSEVLCHTALAGITHPNVAELAEELCSVGPTSLPHVFFSDNGSTSVEVAMQLAIQYWAQNGRPERTRFIAFEEAFHGETVGVTSLGGVDVFREPFSRVLLDCIHVPVPHEPSLLESSLRVLEETISKNSDSLAAIVFESMVQGLAGMRIYDPEFLRAARNLCDQYDVFLVLDEVFTGYGRTGQMWACEHAGIEPDLLCTAKGFTGGVLPMAATLATDRIFDGFLGDPKRAFYYGHTFCGHALGAAVAREVLRVFEEDRILESARPKAQRIAQAFTELEAMPGVARTRSLGMIGALDLSGDAGYLTAVGGKVCDEARARGAYMRPLGNVIYVTPSLNIPDADLDELLEIVGESIAAATQD